MAGDTTTTTVLETYVTLEEDVVTTDGIFAGFVPETPPDDQRSDKISTAEIEYSKVPEKGRYIASKFRLAIRYSGHGQEPQQEAGSRITKIPTRAEIVDSGEWGHQVRLYTVNDKSVIGSLELAPVLGTTDKHTTEGEHYLILELEYDHEYSKQFLGSSEEEICSKRDDHIEWLEHAMKEYSED